MNNVPAIVWPGDKRIIPHAPTDHQYLGLLVGWCRDVLYGGAAGGGKSDLLLMWALQYVDVPGYAALLLRRTFSQLKKPDSLLPRAQSWLHGRAHGVETIDGLPTKWIFRSGAVLDFGHLQHEKDKYDYQGAAYQMVGFDELTQFTPGQIRYLFSRCRRPKDAAADLSRVPLRVRAGSNPGGRSHEFVKQRYLTEGRRLEFGAPSMLERRRLFLPALLGDNPHLDAESYVEMLAELTAYEREQLLSGNWDAKPPGTMFDRADIEVLPAAPRGWRRRVRFWDLAATEPDGPRKKDPDWTVGTRGVNYDEGSDFDLVVEDVERFQLEPGKLEKRIKRVCEADGPGVEQIFEMEGGSSGKIAARSLARELKNHRVRFQRPSGSKIVRAGPPASRVEHGGVAVVRGSFLSEWFLELEHFPSEGYHDDQVDSLSGLYAELVVSGGTSWADLYGQGEETDDDSEEFDYT